MTKIRDICIKMISLSWFKIIFLAILIGIMQQRSLGKFVSDFINFYNNFYTPSSSKLYLFLTLVATLFCVYKNKLNFFEVLSSPI